MTGHRQSTRAAFGFILVTIVLDTLAFGLMVPVLPKLLVTLQGGDTAAAATVLGIFGTAWAVMQFFAAPVLGSLSDRYGRRPVILISLAGLGLDYVLMALAPNIGWLFVGRLISGVTAANYAAVSAYVADITPPDERAKRFGLIGAAWGFGFIVGPAVGGFLAGIDLRAPFWCAAALCLVNAAYGVFVLPESLPADRRSPFKWKHANVFGAFAMLRAMPALLGLAGAAFFLRLGHDVNPAIAVIYSQFRYAWTEQDVGVLLAGVGVCSLVVQALLIGPAVKALGERGALAAGLVCGGIAFMLYGTATTGLMFWIGVPFGALFGLAGAPLQGMLSRSVGPDQQGQLQGALSSVTSVATILAPLLFTQTFALGISLPEAARLPGIPYFIATVLLMVSLALAWRATPQKQDLPLQK
ncbi:MAG: TCR/Tet family MFS transporter [Rhodospirillaceae bacterium]|nr:TCR/Tet family MFS transporter [Rhodospirillaceae bacterium]